MIFLPAREKLLPEQKNLLVHVQKKLVSTHRNLIKLGDAVAQNNLCLSYLTCHFERGCSTPAYILQSRTGVSDTGRRSCHGILKHAITPVIRNSFLPHCNVVLNTTLWYRCRTGQFHETLAVFMISRCYLKIKLRTYVDRHL